MGKVNKLNELMAARESADAVQRVQFELEEVLRDFQTAHEAYHSQIKNEKEREESSRYYNSLLELASELEREITSWLTEPNARRLLTDTSAHILPDDSASNAGFRDTFYTRSGLISEKFGKRKGEICREKGCPRGESCHASRIA